MNVDQLDQKNWGVCGFVAAIQAAYHNKKSPEIIKKDDRETLFSLIENFCTQTQNKDLETELLDFNSIFGKNYKYPCLDKVLDRMRNDLNMTEDDIGIAMTGRSMSRLCKFLGFSSCDFHGTTKTTDGFNKQTFPYQNTIYGLGKKTKSGNYRYGLLHWIYVDSTGEIMTWGKKGQEALDLLNQNNYDKITHYIPF